MSITNPLYNLIQIYKQLRLLEEHLSDREKLCINCITKHLLTAEAYGDEMIQLNLDKSIMSQQDLQQIKVKCRTMRLLLTRSELDIDWIINLLRAVRDLRKCIEPTVVRLTCGDLTSTIY